MDLPIRIRNALPTDEKIIYASWLKPLYSVHPFSELPKDYFMAAHRSLIDRLLKVSNVTIACNINDSDQIYGYMVAQTQKSLIHWVYVKKTFRLFGVAKMLIKTLGDDEITCTCDTPSARALKRKYDFTISMREL